MFNKLSEELKKAREGKQLSINQLSVKTKIDPKFLEAIDAGDFAFMPELYVKAFVREYAKAVGLDDQKIMKKYQAAKQGVYYDEEEPSPESIALDKVPKAKIKEPVLPPALPKSSHVQSYDATAFSNIKDDSSPRIIKRNIVIALAAGAAILILLIYLLFFNKTSDIIVSEKPFEEVVEESKQRYIENKEENINAVEFRSTDSLSLTINAADTSWVKIIFDDKKADEFILFPNSKKTIRTLNNYKITFGKSGAIQLQLNDQPLKFSGRGNAVAHVLIDSSGIKYLTNPPADPN